MISELCKEITRDGGRVRIGVLIGPGVLLDDLKSHANLDLINSVDEVKNVLDLRVCLRGAAKGCDVLAVSFGRDAGPLKRGQGLIRLADGEINRALCLFLSSFCLSSNFLGEL